MSADDFKGRPEDRELYLRLLAERDGPALKALTERDPGTKTQPGRRQKAGRPHAELHNTTAPKSPKGAAA
ncbi:hypothetical protein [Streptomyces sp. MNP-20]|uniref:hypothetical protein n=1 Tax=Streptomyces sp. MNP-20 TaxID=2721165 RepID=UPI0015573A7F|nr:hypothetical protein [Streptomyces sp. MNP-20]